MKSILLIFISIAIAVGVSKSAFAGIEELPNRDKLVAWHSQDNYLSTKIKPTQLPEKVFECEDPNLYPTHPQQNLKAYHIYEWGQYDQHKLTEKDAACVLVSKWSTQKVKPCIKADTAFHVVMSDTFMNSCGQAFRGFIDIYFLQSVESMGTLFSLGRTSYERPGAIFKNDYVAGGTYPIDRSKFMKLTELFAGDSTKVEQSLRELKATHTFDPASWVFTQK